MEAVLFFAMAAVVLAGALGVIVARNPVHSALFLVGVMVAIAVLFATRDADLLAVIQVVVYASAIVVLFLFVIMLLGVDRSESAHDPMPLQRVLAIVLGVVLLVELVLLGGRDWVTGAVRDASDPRALDAPGGNVERLAEVLFTDYFWAFQITSVLLVIAVVGGVVLARRSRRLTAEEAEIAAREAADRAEAGVA
jgi:NADH-quinone oxidoreductase subunit J